MIDQVLTAICEIAGADEGDVPREQRVFRPLTEE